MILTVQEAISALHEIRRYVEKDIRRGNRCQKQAIAVRSDLSAIISVMAGMGWTDTAVGLPARGEIVLVLTVRGNVGIGELMPKHEWSLQWPMACAAPLAHVAKWMRIPTGKK